MFSVKSLLYLQHVGLRGLELTLRAMQPFQPRAETPEEQTLIQNVLEKKSFSLFDLYFTFFSNISPFVLPNSIQTNNLYMNESHINQIILHILP